MVGPYHNELDVVLTTRRDYLAMDLLGASLQGCFRDANSPTMDMRSVLSIAVQVVCHLALLVSLLPRTDVS